MNSAEIAVFTKLGVPLTMEKILETMGLRVDDTVEHWFSRYPWENATKQDATREIVEKVTELIRKKGAPKQGALHPLIV